MRISVTTSDDYNICYAAAFIYGLKLIDEKAAERGVLVIPIDPKRKCEPEIDCTALRVFTHIVGDRIANAQNGRH